MRERYLKSNHSMRFTYLMILPVVSFILALELIALTDVQYQLLSYSITKTLVLGCIFALFSFFLAMLYSRTSSAESLRKACKRLLPMFRKMSFTEIIVLSLAAGISEEMLFRGFLQQWLIDYTSVEGAILTASVIFGLLHSITFSYFVLATTLGLALGITYIISNSLLLVIIWHGIYDIMAIYTLTRNPQWLGIDK